MKKKKTSQKKKREILVQETLERGRDFSWRVMAACIVLNRSTGAVAGPVVSRIFFRWPRPIDLARARARTVASTIKKSGLQNVKARRLKKMSAEYAERGDDRGRFHGVGRYGRDAVRLFVDGDASVRPRDLKLKEYARWLKRSQRGLRRTIFPR